MLEHAFSFPLSDDINMYYCGKRIKTAGHTYGPEIRTHFLIVFIKEGTATLFCENEDIRMCAGQILVMFPNERVHYRVDEDSLWTISWVGVYGSKVSELLAQAGITPQNPVYTVNDSAKISDIMEKIYNRSMLRTIRDKVGCIALLYEFFSEILHTENRNFGVDYVKEAKHIADYNFNKDIKVTEIAKMLHIPLCYLSRIFKEREGVPLKQYILDKKIERAAELIVNKDYTISEISDSVGIHDSLYFSRLFKKKKGMSPSFYRKSI